MTDNERDIRNKEAAEKIAELVRTQANGKSYMVGGCVRDHILGLSFKDVDIEVFGVEPDHLKKILESEFKVDLVGDSFGVLHLKDYDIDVSIPRRERKIGDGHKSFEIYSDPYMTLKEAASRRDFTINAIYLSLDDGKMYDPYGGENDIRMRSLNVVSERFSEDPLRVLRGMQFIGRYDLCPTCNTIQACKELSPKDLTVERIYDEFKKLFIKGYHISKAIDFLDRVDWLKYFPGLNKSWTNWDFHSRKNVFERFGSLKYSPNLSLLSDEDLLALGFSLLLYRNPEKNIFVDKYIHDKTVVEKMKIIDDGFSDIFIMLENNLDKMMKDDSLILNAAYKHKNLFLIASFIHCFYGIDCKPLYDQMNKLGVVTTPPEPVFRGRDLIARGYKPNVKMGLILNTMMHRQLDCEFRTHEEAEQYFDKNEEAILVVSTLEKIT